MIYSFIAASTISENGKVYIEIPFNVWETCGRKGMINTRVCINDYSFECRLIPKGEGIYYIPIIKDVQKNIGEPGEYRVDFEIIEQLTRINNNSPYSIENPIRKIDSIFPIIEPVPNLCGQTSVAMLAGTTVEEVVKVMHAGRGQSSMSRIIETLDYYGIRHADKMVYLSGKEEQLPKLCILTVKMGEGSHYLIYYNNKYYDPSRGMLDSYDDYRKICYLEIFI